MGFLQLRALTEKAGQHQYPGPRLTDEIDPQEVPGQISESGELLVCKLTRI